MALSLVVGPAHAGKVALLLDRFVEALDDDPWLIVPNRVEVDRIERELAARRGAPLAGLRSARSATPSARSCCGGSSPPRARTTSARRPASPASRTRSARR